MTLEFGHPAAEPPDGVSCLLSSKADRIKLAA